MHSSVSIPWILHRNFVHAGVYSQYISESFSLSSFSLSLSLFFLSLSLFFLSLSLSNLLNLSFSIPVSPNFVKSSPSDSSLSIIKWWFLESVSKVLLRVHKGEEESRKKMWLESIKSKKKNVSCSTDKKRLSFFGQKEKVTRREGVEKMKSRL